VGEFGYNRDGKKGKLQIVVGLLTDEKVCEVQAGSVRYVLRKNPDEERKEQHRVEDKLAT
jgi:hypothetical protein